MQKLLIFLLVLVFGCVSGCPCRYKDVSFKARIVSIELDTARSIYGDIDSFNKQKYAVKLTTDMPDRDTMFLDQMIHRTINKRFLDEHQLKEGKDQNGTASIITSGSCPPGRYYFYDSTLNRRN